MGGKDGRVLGPCNAGLKGGLLTGPCAEGGNGGREADPCAEGGNGSREVGPCTEGGNGGREVGPCAEGGNGGRETDPCGEGGKGGRVGLISVVPRSGESILGPEGGTGAPGVLGWNWGRMGPLGLNPGLGGGRCSMPPSGLRPKGGVPEWAGEIW